MQGHVAQAEAVIAAPPEKVWEVLARTGSDPDLMFGAEVVTDWTIGAPIVWRGVFEGKAFEDSGTVRAVAPPRRLVVGHFSPLSGEPDIPENHHLLEYTLTPVDGGTRVTLDQDNNPTEEAVAHARGNWEAALLGMKKVAEADAGR